MNKKAFTLIEVLATIAIIGIISAIGIVAYQSFVNNANNRSYETYRDTMHAEAIYYVTNNYSKITWVDNKVKLTLQDLNMEAIHNPKNTDDLCNNPNDTYVEVTRSYVGNVTSMTYNVCLKCIDYSECKEYEN